MPFLFIAGTRDEALPPSMSSGMDKYFRSLTRGEVNASHWALWEKPEEVNQYIKEFLFGTAGESKL
jgi:soluble epoxide hydrolase/lipid-phosphate phosphatase